MSQEANETFCQAKSLLSELIKIPEILETIGDGETRNASMVYTRAVTLWLLVLQRLGGGLTLQSVVSELVKQHRDLLPKNRRVIDETLSENVSAYNAARSRMPLQAIVDFDRCVCDYLASIAPPAFDDKRVFLLDGSTTTLEPTPELKEAFPPASNQHGESVWPVARLLVAHEMQTGCAMVPQIDPMYGPNNKGETAQAVHAIRQLPDNSIVMADSAFGIFSVAWECRESNKNFLLRLTNQRYKFHNKKATLVEESPTHRTYHLVWKPSAAERRTNPHLPADASLQVFIHQIVVSNGEKINLVSDIEADAVSVGELYKRRYDVEFDIRDIKVTMDTENIRATKLDTIMKELHASIIAYNLVMQFRRQAAKLANIAPRRLSFTGVWTTFCYHLLYPEIKTYEEWTVAYLEALISAAQRRLPNRKTKRSYPRKAHPRRQKSTKFQKQLRKEKAKQAKQAAQMEQAHSPPE